MDIAWLVNIEKTILNAFLEHNENNTVLFDSGLKPEWFYLPAHQKIYEILVIMNEAGKAIDIELLSKALSIEESISVGDAEIIEIVSRVPVPHSVVIEYIKEVAKAFKYRLLSTLSLTINKWMDENIEPDDISILIQNKISDFELIEQKRKTKKLSEIRQDRKSRPEFKRIATGIPFFDSVLNGGLRDEGLIYVSGVKQTGKTFFVTRAIENISAKYPIAFGSLEFGSDLYDENVEKSQNDGYFDGNIENIFTFDNIYDVDHIISELRYLKKVYGIKVAFLDSMLRMTNNKPHLKTDEQKKSDMFSKLGKASKELKLPIFVIVQSSKEDLKSSIISVQGCMNADHESYIWVHFAKYSKDTSDEKRIVFWNKNKDTMKHPKQILEFNPYTSDFYRIEFDETTKEKKILDKRRMPKVIPVVFNENSDNSYDNIDCP